jgi:hypothetical protein
VLAIRKFGQLPMPPGHHRVWLSFVPHTGTKLNHTLFLPLHPLLRHEKSRRPEGRRL